MHDSGDLQPQETEQFIAGAAHADDLVALEGFLDGDRVVARPTSACADDHHIRFGQLQLR